MATSVLPEQLGVPAWRVGDEWAYRQEAPEGASTFVWSVDRTETIDGIAHYVVRSGTRETFYRVSDLAISLSTVSRDAVEQYRPAWQAITWPLTVGKAWEQRFTEERPRDRQTSSSRALAELTPRRPSPCRQGHSLRQCRLPEFENGRGGLSALVFTPGEEHGP
jgi:hypothetical protein